METDKKPKTVSFREYLINLLQDPSEAEAYIKAASEENNPELLELARRDVEEARKPEKSAEISF